MGVMRSHVLASPTLSSVGARSVVSPGPGPKPSSVTVDRVKITIMAGLTIGLALSSKLWLSDRLYPLTPVASFLSPIPFPLDRVFFLLLMATLTAIAMVRRPGKLIGLAAALAVVLALFDQTRLQPWFYQYIVMLIAVGISANSPGKYDDDRHPALNTCRLIVVCTYFWSGLQKAHPDFVASLFPWMIEPITRFFPHSVAAIVNLGGYVAPILETAIGVGLLTRRFRRLAIIGAVAMHALILITLGPLGKSYNSVVWPWNIVMLMLLAILFWPRTNLPARQILWPYGSPFRGRAPICHAIVLLLFGFLPALSFFDSWDAYLSSAMYSPAKYQPVLYVSDSLARRLPEEIRKHAQTTDQLTKKGISKISLWDWSMAEMNVPLYPEPRIYKNVAKSICAYSQPNEMKLLIRRRQTFYSPYNEAWYDCPSLLR
jgi:hypothetical protein